VLHAVRLPGDARVFRPEAGLLGVERKARAIVTRGLFEGICGSAEQSDGISVGFEQPGVLGTQRAIP
jgi:hypothetical protein